MDLKTLLILSLVLNLKTTTPPINYNHEQIYINNKIQQVYSLEIDIKNPNIQLQSQLSYDSIYGFEETSIMAKRTNALAAINGMFYNQYGSHIGLLIKNRELITLPYKHTPVVALTDARDIYIGDLEIQPILKSNHKESIINGINQKPWGKELLLFTDIFGKNTRIKEDSISYVIKKDIVIDKIVGRKPVSISDQGKVLCDLRMNNDFLNIGDKVDISYNYLGYKGDIVEGFQSGGWLVHEGKNISKVDEKFLGITTNNEPRTLLGKTFDGKLVLVVVDGRQPNYSRGITGYEAAELMIKHNCSEAVYLDGGASSTMYLTDKIVNKPSFENRERKIAHILSIIKNRK